MTSVAIPEEWPLGELSDSSRAPPCAKSGRTRPKKSFSSVFSGPISATAVSTQAAVHQRRRQQTSSGRKTTNRNQDSPGVVRTCRRSFSDGAGVAGVQRSLTTASRRSCGPKCVRTPAPSRATTTGRRRRGPTLPARPGRTRTGDDRAVVRGNVTVHSPRPAVGVTRWTGEQPGQQPPADRGDAAAAGALVGGLATRAVARMDEELPWFRAMPADRRSWVMLVAQNGIASLVEWCATPRAAPVDRGGVRRGARGSWCGAVPLRHTVDLIKTTVEVARRERRLGG